MAALFTSLPFLWVAGSALALLAVLGWCHNPTSPIPPKVQAELDALRATRERDNAIIDSLKRSQSLDVSRANEHVAKSAATAQVAVQIGAHADELALLARQAQTADAWKSAYDTRTEQVNSLQHALAYSDSAATEREAARQKLQSALALSELRRNKSEQLNEDLAKAIKTAGRCRVLAFVPCVSRPVAFTAGVVVGGAAGILLARGSRL